MTNRLTLPELVELRIECESADNKLGKLRYAILRVLHEVLEHRDRQAWFDEREDWFKTVAADLHDWFPDGPDKGINPKYHYKQGEVVRRWLRTLPTEQRRATLGE